MLRTASITTKPWTQSALRYWTIGVQNFSTKTINTKDADDWIATLDDETKGKIVDVQNQVSHNTAHSTK